MPTSTFAKALIQWHGKHGRKHLPWQQNKTPYRVWVSEIMLQQTQVGTVIGYFERFMQRFPTVQALAAAPINDVLGLWSGLGYYARARNLHKAAQIICDELDGEFPTDIAALMALPGIGRSTAGAIASLTGHHVAPILDGNVKRIFCRYFAVNGWAGDKKIEHQLWQQAESLLPQKNCDIYNQSLMDLGATVCIRAQPKCAECPLQKNCQAYQQGATNKYPYPKPKKLRPTHSLYFLIIQRQDGAILLEQRPALGIWGGLWSLPEINDLAQLPSTLAKYGIMYQHDKTLKWNLLPIIKHDFSHYRLLITPTKLQLPTSVKVMLMEKSNLVWHPPEKIFTGGLPAPVAKLLLCLQSNLDIS